MGRLFGHLFDPEYESNKRWEAANKRRDERIRRKALADNRALQRAERGTFLSEERRRIQERFSQEIAHQLDQPSGSGAHEADSTQSAGWFGHRADTTRAFEAAEARRDARRARYEADLAARNRQKLFSPTPAGMEYLGGRRQNNVGYAPDTAERKAIRERFKNEIADTESRMGKRAKRAREERLARELAAKQARNAGRTQITNLGGRDKLVETNRAKVLEKQLNEAAAKRQKVSILGKFSWLGKGKKSDGVVGQDDEDLRLFGRGYDAQKLLERVHNPRPNDSYEPGDFNGFIRQQATRNAKVEGVGRLVSVNLNIWDEAEPDLDDPDVEYPY